MDDLTLAKKLFGNERTKEDKASSVTASSASFVTMIAVTSSSNGEVTVRPDDAESEDIWETGEDGVDFIELSEDGDFDEGDYDNVDELEYLDETPIDLTDGDGADIESEDVSPDTAIAFSILKETEASAASEEEEYESVEDPVPGDSEEIEELSDDDFTASDDNEDDESDEPTSEVSDGTTVVETTASVKEGDRVLVAVQDGKMTVIGVVGGGDEEYAERELAAQAAQEAIETAEEVNEKATAAQEAADEAKASAEAATNAANRAAADAESATQAANAAQEAVGPIADEIAGVKTDASQTLKDAIESVAESKVDVMAAGYATKTDLEEREVSLKGEIARSAGIIQTTMEADYARKTDLTDAEVRLQSQITQSRSFSMTGR